MNEDLFIESAAEFYKMSSDVDLSSAESSATMIKKFLSAKAMRFAICVEYRNF